MCVSLSTNSPLSSNFSVHPLLHACVPVYSLLWLSLFVPLLGTHLCAPVSLCLSLLFFFFTVVTVCPFLCVCFSDYRLIRVDSSVCLTPLSVNPLSLSLTLRLSTLCPGQFLRLQFYSCPPLCVSPHHPLHPLYDCQSSPTVIPSGIACWQSAGLVIERLRVRIPAGAAAEFSSPS